MRKPAGGVRSSSRRHIECYVRCRSPRSTAAYGRFDMSTIVAEVLSANQHYQRDFGDKGKLALPTRIGRPR